MFNRMFNKFDGIRLVMISTLCIYARLQVVKMVYGAIKEGPLISSMWRLQKNFSKKKKEFKSASHCASIARNSLAEEK